MFDKVNWEELPEPIRQAMLSALGSVVYDLATDQSQNSAADIVKLLFSVVHPVGSVCSEVRSETEEALANAANESNIDVSKFKPVTEFDPW